MLEMKELLINQKINENLNYVKCPTVTNGTKINPKSEK